MRVGSGAVTRLAQHSLETSILAFFGPVADPAVDSRRKLC